MNMIGVIGAGACDEGTYEMARRVGAGIANMRAVLVCGGLGGVMEGACRGAVEAGGQAVGILPGSNRATANPFVTIPVVTNAGHARNIIIAHTADVLIAISGGYGTLSEMAIGLKLGKPVIGLHTWPDLHGVEYVGTAREALEAVARHC